MLFADLKTRCARGRCKVLRGHSDNDDLAAQDGSLHCVCVELTPNHAVGHDLFVNGRGNEHAIVEPAEKVDKPKFA